MSCSLEIKDPKRDQGVVTAMERHVGLLAGARHCICIDLVLSVSMQLSVQPLAYAYVGLSDTPLHCLVRELLHAADLCGRYRHPAAIP